jgi:hypothetical protein
MQQCALGAVALKLSDLTKIRETELADVDYIRVYKIDGVGRKVPGLNLELAHLYLFQVTHSRDLSLVLRHGTRCAKLLNLIFA